MADLKRRLLLTVCSSVHEGHAAVRIAEFLNKKLKDMGEDDVGLPGLVMAIDTGEQCTLAGSGHMFEEFMTSEKVVNYTGYGTQPTKFYDRQKLSYRPL